jgi:hypothetical protein
MGECATTERHLGGALRVTLLTATNDGDHVFLAHTTMNIHSGGDSGFVHGGGSAMAGPMAPFK